MRGAVSLLFAAMMVMLAGAKAGEPAPDPGAYPDPYPSARTRSYDPVSKNAEEDLGTLRLSQTFASFSEQRGHMVLEYAGTLPETGDEEVSGARVYRVINAAVYYKKNRKARGSCNKPVQWLGVRMTPIRRVDLPDVPSDMVWVSQFTEPDFAKLTMAAVCQASVFGLSHFSE